MGIKKYRKIFLVLFILTLIASPKPILRSLVKIVVIASITIIVLFVLYELLLKLFKKIDKKYSDKKHTLEQNLKEYFSQTYAFKSDSFDTNRYQTKSSYQSQKNHLKEHTQEQSKEHKKDEFESKQQTETSAQYKGRLYEYKIKCYLENQGFKVYPNGYINGKKDKGIDLIAYKDNDIHLIQCKCYRYPPKQDLIRKFYGDCKFYEDKNPNLVKNKTMVYRFITSCKDMDYSTQKYLEENTFIRYEIINI